MSAAVSAIESSRRAVLAAVENGVFSPGKRLPSERSLAAQLDVSRETLRQALKDLAQQGVLSSSPQRGWFVTANMLSDPPNELQSFTDMAHARGLKPTTRVLSSTQRPVRHEEAERLSLPPTSPLLDIHRLRSLDGVPVSVDRTVVSLARAPGLADVDLSDASLYQVLETVCDVQVARSNYSVRADGADDRTAELLGIDPGMPVLVGDEVTFDLRDLPVLYGQLTYRGDAYRFEATLFRPRR
ncbi:GntR family transcriptional regulator [Aeromicrobium sp. CTD01-1L150]|uniref:GntR family transcriptional regulator n=1 Tax=Aeromicrobium sp. CTD01-1L150 TaxID=3341830 RepID=UPI0035C1931D